MAFPPKKAKIEIIAKTTNNSTKVKARTTAKGFIPLSLKNERKDISSFLSQGYPKKGEMLIIITTFNTKRHRNLVYNVKHDKWCFIRTVE
jgi:hypothetical protein